MAGLLSYQLTPQANTGQFLGDALSGIGAGLLAYGSGGQARNNAGLLGIQALQQAQQNRQEQAYRALQTQSMTQQLAMQQQAAERQQQAIDQANQQREAYKSLLGGQPVQGPTPSGAPLDMKSPVNPALSSLAPAIQQILPVMDPDQGTSLIAQLATKKPKVPNIQEWQDGSNKVYGYLDEKGNKHIISSGPAWDPNSNQNQTKFGNTPIYGQDQNGNMVLLAMGNNGTVTQPALPNGVKLTPGTTLANLGTSFQPIDKHTGQPVGAPLAIDNTGKAEATAKGTAQGQAQFSLPTAINSIDSTIKHVQELKTDPNLPSALGLIGSQWSKVKGTAAYGVRQKIEQVAGESFLSARQQLKGGGQITDYEGSKAEQALVRLNSAQKTDDFLKALDDFQTHLENGKQILIQQAGGGTTGSSAPTQNAPQAPVNGAKQAPDGNWYVPDPNRPGKYLQVVQ